MKVFAPMPMPYHGSLVPHGLIEVNQKCNISCTACYKSKMNYSKTLLEIYDEIDQIMSLRKLSLLTLAGGEPTLHPDLQQVISYIRQKGVKAQFLTNGYALNNEQLTSFKASGLNKVYVHVDSLQNRPDLPVDLQQGDEKSLHPLRDRIGQMIRQQDIDCALAFTLYRKNFESLPEMVDYVLRSPHYQRMLVTICTDFSEIAEFVNSHKIPQKMDLNLIGEEPVTNQEVKSALLKAFSFQPFGYVGSTFHPQEQRWLMYYIMIIETKNSPAETICFDGRFSRILKPLNAISLRIKGKYPFGQVLSPRKSILLCLMYAAVLGDLKDSLKILKQLTKLLQKGSTISQKSFVFQEGPRLTKNGEIDYCADCPDATIRDGVLTPVCTADILYPPSSLAKGQRINEHTSSNSSTHNP